MASKDYDAMEDSNRSDNPSIHEVSDPTRRTVLRGSLGLAAAALYGPMLGGCAAPAGRDPGTRWRLPSASRAFRSMPATGWSCPMATSRR